MWLPFGFKSVACAQNVLQFTLDQINMLPVLYNFSYVDNIIFFKALISLMSGLIYAQNYANKIHV